MGRVSTLALGVSNSSVGAPGHVFAFGAVFEQPCAYGGACERAVRLRAAAPAEDGAAACRRHCARNVLGHAVAAAAPGALHGAAAACAGAPAHARVAFHEGAQAEGVVPDALRRRQQRRQQRRRRSHAAAGRRAAQRQHAGAITQRGASVACTRHASAHVMPRTQADGREAAAEGKHAAGREGQQAVAGMRPGMRPNESVWGRRVTSPHECRRTCPATSAEGVRTGARRHLLPRKHFKADAACALRADTPRGRVRRHSPAAL